MTQQDDTTAVNTTEPRIFITVERLVQGHCRTARREISLDVWLQRRSTQFLGPEIDAMLREVGHGR